MSEASLSNAELGPPNGDWVALDSGPFDALTGPFWRYEGVLEPDEPLRLGFHVGTKHTNRGGACHGGMLATFLDMALGLSVHRAAAPGVTMTLTVDYLAAAMPGEWIESRVRFLQGTWRTGSVDGLAKGPNGPVARASGLWRLNRPKDQVGQ